MVEFAKTKAGVDASEKKTLGEGLFRKCDACGDAVKKEALRKAGIGYHEIVAGHTTAKELRALVEKLVPGEAARARG